MANELNIALQTGLTVTAQRYQGGAAVGSPIAMSEISTSGVYTGDMTGSAGTYQIAFISAASNVGAGSIIWDGSAEVPYSTLTAAQVNAECDTSLADVGLTTTVTGRVDVAVSTRLASASYVAPDNADILLIKAKTDNLPADPAGVSNIPTAAQNATATWVNVTRTLTSGSGIVPTASENALAVWTYSQRTLTSGGGGTTTTITSDTYEQNPGELNIQAVVGNDISMPLNFDVNLTGYTFESIIKTQQNGVTKEVPFTVTNTDLSAGIITLALTDAQTQSIGEVNNVPWYLNWTSGSNTRTILAGNFTLNRQ